MDQLFIKRLYVMSYEDKGWKIKKLLYRPVGLYLGGLYTESFWWACIRGDCIRSFTVFAKIIYVFQSLTTFVKEAPSYMFDRARNMSLRRFRSSRQEVFCQKGVLRNFSKFTEKHLC